MLVRAVIRDEPKRPSDLKFPKVAEPRTQTVTVRLTRAHLNLLGIRALRADVSVSKLASDYLAGRLTR